MSHDFIRAELKPHFDALARCRSTAELLTLPLYRELEPKLRLVLRSPATGSYARGEAAGERPLSRRRLESRARNRARGQLEPSGSILISGLQTCCFLRKPTSAWRARGTATWRGSSRRAGFHFAFAPCYLNLAKGAGREYEVRGENEVGLHGNAILSRYPLESARVIPLENGKDKMAGWEKRLGSQAALAVEVRISGSSADGVALHLDAQSRQSHRRDQIRDVLQALEGCRAVHPRRRLEHDDP